MSVRGRGSLLLMGLLLAGCHERRLEPRDAPATYREIAPLLARSCTECHGEDTPPAGYSVTDHWSAIGCTSDGRAVTIPSDASAPLLQVLERKDHRDLLSRAERDQLATWVSAGTPLQRSVIHAAGTLDPRSESWHGKLAAQEGYRALWDKEAETNCGRCHQGAPTAPSGKTGETDGATPCTSCHAKKEGVLACGTCHGAEDRSYPPRDACYFGGPARDPHAAHLEHSDITSEPLSCDTCHPVPAQQVFKAPHMNGQIDVRFSSPLLKDSASVHEDGSCSVACHARGGSRSEPRWEVDAELDCQSCHLSPPADHPPGACSTCHPNMGEASDSLVRNALHINGVVDLGDGSGSCGACHGRNEDGAPRDVGHDQHLSSLLTTPIVCTECHPTPSLSDLHAPATHMNGAADVVFDGRALGERPPRYDAAQKTCAQVTCHRDPRVEPRWGRPSGASSTCNACHETPPPAPHSSLPGCGGALCHGSEVAPLAPGFRITESGRRLHIDGFLQPGAPARAF